MTQRTNNAEANIFIDSKLTFDLEGYFARIGYTGDKEPTIENLIAIHRLHAEAIPFENLNPFLRIPVALDIDSLYTKLVVSNRGGYCFEHNLLFMEVLKRLGFDVKGLAARVLWNAPEGAITPRGHMLLLITLADKRYIADVGFGGLTLTSPLVLETDRVQHTPHEDFKLTRTGEEYLLSANVQATWKRVYSFGLQENLLPDYEVTSWYLSNHPASHFVTGLIAAKPFGKGRHALRNNDFVTHFINGEHERKRIDNVDALREILENTFGIVLPEAPHLNKHLQTIVQGAVKT